MFGTLVCKLDTCLQTQAYEIILCPTFAGETLQIYSLVSQEWEFSFPSNMKIALAVAVLALIAISAADARSLDKVRTNLSKPVAPFKQKSSLDISRLVWQFHFPYFNQAAIWLRHSSSFIAEFHSSIPFFSSSTIFSWATSNYIPESSHIWLNYLILSCNLT